ncbi:hypothetical protein C0J52_20470 [Blattella germanica]|nr:hypothetical protein C0J52_20470 [Blattella germanica]
MSLTTLIPTGLLHILFIIALINAEVQNCPKDCKCLIPWAVCKEGKLEDLAEFTDERITALSLHRYNIGTLESNSLSALKIPVWKIQITESNLQTVKRDAFKGLDKLQAIQLNRNNIKQIETGAFAGLPELTTINLQNNQIQTLEPGVFEGVHLTHLHLDHNLLNSLNPEVFKNVALTTIRDNPLSCDCSLKTVKNILGSKLNGVTCGSPENLKNKNWDILTSLNC